MEAGSIAYGYSIQDGERIHSIDKLIIDYEYVPDTIDCFCSLFSSLSGFKYYGRDSSSYNSYFDKPASSAYSWFKSSFWFEHCNVKFGKYVRQPMSKVFEEKKILRVEFNPNYVYETDLFNHLQSAICRYCKIGILVEVDYAVDVPGRPSEIISKSRSKRVTYDESRYYGSRHNHDRLKIYDKTAEYYEKKKIDIGSQITRCEVTYKFGGNITFNQLSKLSGDTGIEHLSNNLLSIAKLIQLLNQYGENIQDILFQYVPDKRNRNRLEKYLLGHDSEYIFNKQFFYKLMLHYAITYYFWFSFSGDDGRTFNCPLGSINNEWSNN